MLSLSARLNQIENERKTTDVNEFNRLLDLSRILPSVTMFNTTFEDLDRLVDPSIACLKWTLKVMCQSVKEFGVPDVATQQELDTLIGSDIYKDTTNQQERDMFTKKIRDRDNALAPDYWNASSIMDYLHLMREAKDKSPILITQRITEQKLATGPNLA